MSSWLFPARPSDRVSTALQEHGTAVVSGMTLADVLLSAEQVGLKAEDVQIIGGAVVVRASGRPDA